MRIDEEGYEEGVDELAQAHRQRAFLRGRGVCVWALPRQELSCAWIKCRAWKVWQGPRWLVPVASQSLVKKKPLLSACGIPIMSKSRSSNTLQDCLRRAATT